MDNSTKNDRIEAALNALDSQKKLNYTAVSREYGIDRRTLARRYCGESVS
jgi:transposase-like protein